MILKGIRAILFDLNGTLAYVDDPISCVDLSDLLFSRGYEISPQQLSAACFFVSMVDTVVKVKKSGFKTALVNYDSPFPVRRGY